MTSNNNSFDKKSEKKQESHLFSYLNKINLSFLYAEKVLIISIFVLIIGIFAYIYLYLNTILSFTNVHLLTTGTMIISSFFILFLSLIMFAFGYKFILDIYLWKHHSIKQPLIISFITLAIIFGSSFLPPTIALFIILLCSLSVGIRINSTNFLNLVDQITENDNLKK